MQTNCGTRDIDTNSSRASCSFCRQPRKHLALPLHWQVFNLLFLSGTVTDIWTMGLIFHRISVCLPWPHFIFQFIRCYDSLLIEACETKSRKTRGVKCILYLISSVLAFTSEKKSIEIHLSNIMSVN